MKQSSLPVNYRFTRSSFFVDQKNLLKKNQEFAQKVLFFCDGERDKI